MMQKQNNITDECMSLYTKGVSKPTALIELSKTQWKRFSKNSIHLQGLYRKVVNGNAPQSLYSEIKFGSNINTPKCRVSSVEVSFVNHINLNKTKKNFMMITSDKAECVNFFKDVCVFDTCMNQIIDSMSKKKIYLSGVVVLMLAALPGHNTKLKPRTVFNNELYKEVKKAKSDVKKSFDHFGSVGEVYAFGNKPNYGIVDESSVATFVNKKSKIPHRNKMIDATADKVDRLCAEVISDGMSLLSVIIPHIRILVSPILDSAAKTQTCLGREVIKEVNTTASGFWNCMLNVNGATNQLHSENDATYSLITVPKQSFKMTQNIELLPTFLFRVTANHHVMLKLEEHVCFVYNARFLAHRQAFSKGVGTNENFFNISCYGNQKLFSHLKNTFDRLNKHK